MTSEPISDTVKTSVVATAKRHAADLDAALKLQSEFAGPRVRQKVAEVRAEYGNWLEAQP